MRIIHCLRAPVGGLFRHVLDLAAAQAAIGHDVGLIADSNATDALTQQRLAAIAPKLTLGIHRLPMHRAPGFCDVASTRAVIRRIRPLGLDVVHGHGAKGGAFARLSARVLKAQGQPIRAFYTPHGGTLNYAPSSMEGRIFLGLEKILDRMTDGLIFESGFAARLYADRIRAGRAPRRIIHNGLQPRDFEAVTARDDASDFLFIGELRNVKGVDTLLHALAALNRDRETPLTATIVGSGPDGEALKRLAATLGLAAVTAFPGAMPAAHAFELGRVLVVPSLKESFPYVVLEAAAAGLPLIATDVGGIPEIVEGTGVNLIAPGDAASLARAMLEIVHDPITAQSRAERLKTAVADRFTVNRMTGRVLEFYSAPGSYADQPAVARASAPACAPAAQA